MYLSGLEKNSNAVKNNQSNIASHKNNAVSRKTFINKYAKLVSKEEKPVSRSTNEFSSIESPAITNNTMVPQSQNSIKVVFQLKYHTTYGQNIFITGNCSLLGNNDVDKALPLHFLNDEYWQLEIELDKDVLLNHPAINYNYLIRNADGSVTYDCGKDKTINVEDIFSKELLILDSWNFTGYYENVFYSEPFKEVLLNNNNNTLIKTNDSKNTTHTFKVKAPLLMAGQTLCLLGSGKIFKNWNETEPVLLSKKDNDDFYSVQLDLSEENFPVSYKYAVYNIEQNKLIRYEAGGNRVLNNAALPETQTIVNDGFAVLPNNTWKGAGVAIPVFSLKTKNSFGVGEFADIKTLADWCKHTGIKLIQLLPVNDTTSSHTWKDSYPYAAISAFALHPLFLNLDAMTGHANKHLLSLLEEERIRLNELENIDYEAVMNLKLSFINKIYPLQKDETFASEDYQKFFRQNKHWLIPYAVFCYLRDENKTAHFNEWPLHTHYSEEETSSFLQPGSPQYDAIAISFFIQYHLHLQLKAATKYAHENGIIVKGDIAIGVNRYGVDAWQHPELFHMNMQAGAPPDDFAVKGQNWSFPTYNWNAMRADGFAWWTQRFEQMSHYFDAFRIDHILGFFRIWSIPIEQVEGIMGYFVPSIPVHINEFNQQRIWFNYERYTKPFITDMILLEIFGHDNQYVKENFLSYDGYGNFILKPEFDTQRKVEKYFESKDDDFNKKIKYGLFDLISNIILFEVKDSNGLQYHFRFGMDHTTSFRYLDAHTRNQLYELYIDYFFRRQDGFWMKEAMQKLPALKNSTNMLICGEDLGLVPSCVPEVMKQLGLLSLEVQRMPKDPNKTFSHPNDAPYLSVVTPSTHDMSTIRGWWEEDKEKIQQFYNNGLGQWGSAPFYCEPWINRNIVLQHLYSPAMWSIFQIQDLLGMSGDIRRINPNDERINVPANPNNYWRYRMHLHLEDLLKADDFNNQLRNDILLSGR